MSAKRRKAEALDVTAGLPLRAGSRHPAGVVRQLETALKASLDHLIGASEQRWRQSEAERTGGLEVDDEFEPRRLLDR